MTDQTYYRPLIETAARATELDPDLVEAIVWQESSYQTCAYRYEPGFWTRYLAGKPAWIGQLPRRVSASYGLMQVMYPTARERGFIGQPEELCVPAVGLAFGCTHLAYLVARAQQRAPRLTLEQMRVSLLAPYADVVLRAVLASYNGGEGGNAPDEEPDRNRAYASEVLAKLRIIQQSRAGTLTA